MKLKISHKVTPIENPLQIRALRRTIARLITEMGKRIAQA
jgi:large subunit ribosomal protein L29